MTLELCIWFIVMRLRRGAGSALENLNMSPVFFFNTAGHFFSKANVSKKPSSFMGENGFERPWEYRKRTKNRPPTLPLVPKHQIENHLFWQKMRVLLIFSKDHHERKRRFLLTIVKNSLLKNPKAYRHNPLLWYATKLLTHFYIYNVFNVVLSILLKKNLKSKGLTWP